MLDTSLKPAVSCGKPLLVVLTFGRRCLQAGFSLPRMDYTRFPMPQATCVSFTCCVINIVLRVGEEDHSSLRKNSSMYA